MKPTLSEILGGAAMTLATGVVPHLEHAPYAKGHASAVMLLLILAAQEAAGASAHLAAENAAMAELLGEPPPPGGDIASLEQENARLKTALIGVHARVEQENTPQAAALEAAILAFLAQASARRVLHLPPL